MNEITINGLSLAELETLTNDQLAEKMEANT
jgi:hypothetical protein